MVYVRDVMNIPLVFGTYDEYLLWTNTERYSFNHQTKYFQNLDVKKIQKF